MTIEESSLNKRRRLSMDNQSKEPSVAITNQSSVNDVKELPFPTTLEEFLLEPTVYRPRDEYVKGIFYVEVRFLNEQKHTHLLFIFINIAPISRY